MVFGAVVVAAPWTFSKALRVPERARLTDKVEALRQSAEL